MARPRKQVDLEKLRNLALIGLSNIRIAQALGISHDTLTGRFKRQLDEGRGDAESQVLAKIFQLALNGNVRCLELCAINRCGWANRPEVLVNVTQNTLSVPSITEETKAKLAQLHQLIRREALIALGNSEPNGNGESNISS